MKCTNHPEREADGMCAYCGKPFCKDCLVEVKGRMYCKNDLGNVLDEAKQQASSTTAIPTINITNSNESSNTNTNTNSNPSTVTPGLPARKSKLVALILCILGFFGFAGLHRMYVGKVGSGFLQLFTFGFCLIGTIMDLISILSGGFRDSYGQPMA